MHRDRQRTPWATPAKGSSDSQRRIAGRVGLTLATLVVFVACQGAGGPTQTPAPQPTSPVVAATQSAPTPAPTAKPAPTTSLTPSPTPTLAATATIAATPATTAPPTSAAITVTGDDGVAITLASAPRKVVSLTPATSELMFALGGGDRLVGRTDYDDYPPQVADVPAVATFQGVEIEKVVAAAPDLVIAGGNGFTHQADIDQMRSLNIPVLVVYAQDLPGVLTDIELVGTAVGEADAAQTIDTGIQTRIDEVTNAVSGLDQPRTFYELGVDTAIYAPAPDSFVADMVNLAGGQAITTSDPASFSISLEQLVSQDPQVIVLGDAAYGACPDVIAQRPGWKRMTAVKDGAVRPVYDTIVTRPGPRIGDGLAALALAIHPDAAITPVADQPALCQAPSPS
jgi:iron complex transport system substrate-binding protein